MAKSMLFFCVYLLPSLLMFSDSVRTDENASKEAALQAQDDADYWFSNPFARRTTTITPTNADSAEEDHRTKEEVEKADRIHNMPISEECQHIDKEIKAETESFDHYEAYRTMTKVECQETCMEFSSTIISIGASALSLKKNADSAYDWKYNRLSNFGRAIFAFSVDDPLFFDSRSVDVSMRYAKPGKKTYHRMKVPGIPNMFVPTGFKHKSGDAEKGYSFEPLDGDRYICSSDDPGCGKFNCAMTFMGGDEIDDSMDLSDGPDRGYKFGNLTKWMMGDRLTNKWGHWRRYGSTTRAEIARYTFNQYFHSTDGERLWYPKEGHFTLASWYPIQTGDDWKSRGPNEEMLSDEALSYFVFDAIGGHRVEVRLEGDGSGQEAWLSLNPIDYWNGVRPAPVLVPEKARYTVRLDYVEGADKLNLVRDGMQQWGGIAYFNKDRELIEIQFDGTRYVTCFDAKEKNGKGGPCPSGEVDVIGGIRDAFGMQKRLKFKAYKMPMNGNGKKSEIGEEEWKRMKFYFRSSLLAMVTAHDHLLVTHGFMSNFLATAAVEASDGESPIWNLLIPHVWGTLGINYRAAHALFFPSQLVHRASPYTGDMFRNPDDPYGDAGNYGTLWGLIPTMQFQSFDTAYKQYQKNVRIAETPAEIPFFDDGIVLYRSVHKYVGDFLEQFGGCAYTPARLENSSWTSSASEGGMVTDNEKFPMVAGMEQFFKNMFESFDNVIPKFFVEGEFSKFRRDAEKNGCRGVQEVLTEVIYGVTGWHKHVGTVGDYYKNPYFAGTSWGTGEDVARPQHAFMTISLAAGTASPQPKLWDPKQKEEDCSSMASHVFGKRVDTFDDWGGWQQLDCLGKAPHPDWLTSDTEVKAYHKKINDISTNMYKIVNKFQEELKTSVKPTIDAANEQRTKDKRVKYILQDPAEVEWGVSV